MYPNTVTLKHYRQLARHLPFYRLRDKLCAVVGGAILVPVLGLAFLAGRGASAGDAALALLVFVGASVSVAVWALFHFLAPLRMTQSALRAYRDEHRVLPLPTDLNDEMGELLRSVRSTLESVDEQRAQIDHEAAHDRLTALPNRRAAEDYLRLAAHAAESSGARLSVALIHVDPVRAINDEHGQAAGDRALAGTAEFLKLWVRRKSDWLGRWTGAGFIAVMFCDEDSASALFDNLRREFARQMRDFEGTALWLTAGISERRRHEDISHCLKRADEALTHARNPDQEAPEGGVSGRVRPLRPASEHA